MNIATQVPTKKRTAWSYLKPEVKLSELKLRKLPTMYDLPSENKTEEPALDEYHHKQANFFTETFIPPDYPANKIFTAMDMYLYYDPDHPTWYKRADWFAVVGVSHLYRDGEMRSSYVVWDEGVAPFVVAEFLSPSTENEDLGFTPEVDGRPPTKWKVYEKILQIPYYLIFNKRDNKLRAYKLVNKKYQEQKIVDNRLWIPELKVGVGVWYGSYQSATRNWLRWYDANGEWLPTVIERERREAELRERQAREKAELRIEQERREVERERQAREEAELRIEQERREKEQERREKERLAAKLRELGIDPTTV
jgi:Uma2 family endonuclease